MILRVDFLANSFVLTRRSHRGLNCCCNGSFLLNNLGAQSSSVVASRNRKDVCQIRIKIDAIRKAIGDRLTGS